MTDREKVLLEILAEVTRPKTDHDTTRMEHPRRPGSQLGNLLYPDFQALALELEKDRDYWKAQAEATAKSLAQAHEELERAQKDAEGYRGKFSALLDERQDTFRRLLRAVGEFDGARPESFPELLALIEKRIRFERGP